jgi:hypothetical protein
MGRRSGKTSNAAHARACKPKDVRVVNPRRERSSHDELIVLANILSVNLVSLNIVSSSWSGLLIRTPDAPRTDALKQRKKAALDAAFRNFFDICGVAKKLFGWCG